ncbi:MAG: response regulator transcription factor [Gammaproteobacteria bacterium]|nr:response regulator transcription factor [Gammaproteobacteria bacterium]
MERHQVLLVEDDDNTRQRLMRIVDRHADLSVVAATASLAAARGALAETKPRVLLVDLDLPDGSGIDLIREARNTHPCADSMVITVFADEQHVVAALEAGASGYLLKDGASKYVAESILQLIAGGSPISAAIARHLLKRFQPQPEPNADEALLTAREREVLELVAKGFAYAEIADVLGMSVHTVTSHIKHIYRKLAVRSRGQAVFEAMQRGLIRPPG